MKLRRKREPALICGLLSLLVIASCRIQNEPGTPAPSAETIVSSTPPFQTKEPDRYRATRTVTSTTPDGKITIIKTTTARDGEMRRVESEFESKRLIMLNVPEGMFVLLPDDKVFADKSGETVPGTVEDGEISPDKLLHDETGSSSYQKLGAEQIGGRNTIKYRIVVNGSNAANVTPSETLIWIDEALGMPIKSETKSSDGARVTMELSEIALVVDRDVFRLPTDYQKLTLTELFERLKVRK